MKKHIFLLSLAIFFCSLMPNKKETIKRNKLVVKSAVSKCLASIERAKYNHNWAPDALFEDMHHKILREIYSEFYRNYEDRLLINKYIDAIRFKKISLFKCRNDIQKIVKFIFFLYRTSLEQTMEHPSIPENTKLLFDYAKSGEYFETGFYTTQIFKVCNIGE